MVAGLSSRFGGKIKQFAEVGSNGETLIEYSLNQALPAGFSKIIFIVGNKTEKPFREKFGENYHGIPIFYALQKFDEEKRDKPWGTVDAICTIKDLIDCPFVVCNGDDLYGKETFQILAMHLQNKSTNATVGYKLANVLAEGSVNRGIFELNSDKTINSLREVFNITKENLKEKALSEEDLCSMNIFALQPEIIDKLNFILQDFKQKNTGDRKVECLLPQEFGNLIKNNKLTIYLYPTKNSWMGITNPGDELKVKEQLFKII
jgi:NDP-sugar pyrophosphorylase family protein